MRKNYDHHVVAGAITWKFDEEKLLFLHRQINDRYWPDKWYILTEHIKKNETEESALARGLKSETGLKLKDIISGPYKVLLIEPNHPEEQFHVKVYHCTPEEMFLDGRIRLNKENIDHCWHNPERPLDSNSKFNGSKMIEGLPDHLLGVRIFNRLYPKQ
jgi:hypothetical protein